MADLKLNFQILYQLGNLFCCALLASWSSLVLAPINFTYNTLLIYFDPLLVSLASWYFTMTTDIVLSPNGTFRFHTNRRLVAILASLIMALFFLHNGMFPLAFDIYFLLLTTFQQFCTCWITCRPSCRRPLPSSSISVVSWPWWKSWSSRRQFSSFARLPRLECLSFSPL